MATDVDMNIITTFLDITCRLLETKNPHEITTLYLGDLKFPEYTNSLQISFPHETDTSVPPIYEKYLRRFTRLLDNIQTLSCTFILCTRFTKLSHENYNQMKILLDINPTNRFLIFSGVEQGYIHEINDVRIHIEIIPYERINFYDYDYTNFRPTIKSRLVALLYQ